MSKAYLYKPFLESTKIIVRCCIYLTTYVWIKSFLKITIEGRAIYGNLENKINMLYWPVENSICQVTAALCNLFLHNLTLTPVRNKEIL